MFRSRELRFPAKYSSGIYQVRAEIISCVAVSYGTKEYRFLYIFMLSSPIPYHVYFYANV